MRDEGSAAVEFALVLPLVLLVLLAVVEVALVARTQIEVVNAAREGARQAATSPDPARAVAAVRRALGSRGGEARVGVRRPDAVGSSAEVTVDLPYRFAAPVVGGFTVVLHGRATMRVER